MPEVRVFIVPRTVQRGGVVVTALRAALDDAGLSRGAAAKLSGVSKPTIANLANGVGGVERRKADAIAAALGRPTVDLFCHKDTADVVGGW